MIVWTAGHNMPGYLPESDPVVFLTRLDALQYTAGELRDRADFCSEGDTEDDARWLADYESTADRLQESDAAVDGDWYERFEDGRIVYWFEAVDLPADEVPESLGGTLADY